MKFTSEDLMKAMGLQVGDRVKIAGHIYIVKHLENIKRVILKDDKINHEILLSDIVDAEYDVLPRTKRVGENLCKQYCNGCPLIVLQCFGDDTKNKPLYEVLDYTTPRYQDQEIYDLLKARLDKVVE